MQALAEKAFVILEDRFMRGDYMPNDKLSENQLCKELEMSRTPIRQALSKLIEKDYIVSVDKKGIFVKPISMKYAVDCRDLAMTLELMMVDLLQKQHIRVDEAQLQHWIDAQHAAKQADDYYTYLLAHFHFRMALFDYANNSALSRAYQQLLKDLIRIIMIVWRKTMNEPHYSTIARNEQLLAFAVRQDFAHMRDVCSTTYTFELDAKKIRMYENLVHAPHRIFE